MSVTGTGVRSCTVIEGVSISGPTMTATTFKTVQDKLAGAGLVLFMHITTAKIYAIALEDPKNPLSKEDVTRMITTAIQGTTVKPTDIAVKRGTDFGVGGRG